MKIEIAPYDTAEYLDNEEIIHLFMKEAFATNDPSFIAHALGVVARARGMTEIAKKAGLSRESLYKALSGTGNPAFETILNVAKALNFAIKIVPVEPAPRRKPKAVKAPTKRLAARRVAKKEPPKAAKTRKA